MKKPSRPSRQGMRPLSIGLGSVARLGLALLCVTLPGLASSAPPSEEQKAAFLQYVSCPANGRRSGYCPGYTIVYRVPQCVGGQERWTNMLWLDDISARQKLKRDAITCANTGTWDFRPQRTP